MRFAPSMRTIFFAFMSEKCEADDRILIQGHRWLSMIAFGPTEKRTEPLKAFPVDEAILREKLSQVNSYHATVQGSDPPDLSVNVISLSGWDAVYGRLDSPARLKPHVPPSGSHSRNTPGNGYGANGTVPVRIFVINSKPLP